MPRRWPLLLLAILLPIVIAWVLLWLFWRPWLSSSDIPSDRLATIFAAVGQVLFTFFVALVAALTAINEPVSKRRRELQILETGQMTGDTWEQLLPLLRGALERVNGIVEFAWQDNLMELEREHSEVGDLEGAEASLKRIRTLPSILPKGNIADKNDHDPREACLSVVSRLERVRLISVIRFRRSDLERQERKLLTTFVALLTFTLVECLICFAPDTLLAHTFTVREKYDQLPSGVAALSIGTVLFGIFAGTTVFLRYLVALHASSVREIPAPTVVRDVLHDQRELLGRVGGWAQRR